MLPPLTEISRARRDVAVERHHLRQAAIDALRRRLAPARALGHRVQHGEVLRVLGHQLAPELERVLAGGLRQLVHEALDEDRVLVDVHAAPEARRDVRVAHRVVDQQVRDGVAERELARSGRAPWNVDRVRAVLQRSPGARRRGSTAPRCACAGR